MARPFFVLVVISLLLSACTQRMICPAYQSAFIYDKNELRKRFSYFQEDSTPKIFTASKTKYLIAEPMSYRKKIRSMQTVAMTPVNPVVPDSLQIGNDALDEELAGGEEGEDGVVPGAELDLAARSVIDSTYIEDVPIDTSETYADSVYVISKDKEVRLLKYNFPDSLKYDEATGKYVSETPKYVVQDVRYNVEQDNYMWYLRNNLVLPDVRLSQLQQSAQKEAEAKAAKGQKKKKGFFGFFKGLFKKKEQAPVDSTEQMQPKTSDDFDYVENDSIRQRQQDSIRAAQPEEKKGFLKRKKKKEEAPTEEEITPVDEKPKNKRREKKPKEDDANKPEDDPIVDDEEDETDDADSF
jgi:hypothetical protein